MPTRRDPQTGLALRGTTNQNHRGSSEQRRRRKEYLLWTYLADVDAVTIPRVQIFNNDPSVEVVGQVPLGEGEQACRCYRCGTLLVFETLTVDRIVPHCEGGTYARTNIRPACLKDNSTTGAVLATTKTPAKKRTKRATLKVVGT